MNSTVFRISLDIHEVNSQVTLRVKKGDSARQILIALTEGGRPYKISEDCMAVFTAKKPDETILYNGCEIQGNRILYAMTPQTCTVVGAMKCEIRVYGAGGALITSPRFTILVDNTVYSDGDVVDSSSEFTVLTRLLSDMLTLQQRLEQFYHAKLPLVRGIGQGNDTYGAEEASLGALSAGSFGAHEGKGTRILFVPDSENTTNSPTLSLNGGEAIPIRLRARRNQGENADSPEAAVFVPVGALMRGVPYTMTFCGKYWLVDSFISSDTECASDPYEAETMRAFAAKAQGLRDGDSVGVPVINTMDGVEHDVGIAYIARTQSENEAPDKEGFVEIPSVALVHELIAEAEDRLQDGMTSDLSALDAVIGFSGSTVDLSAIDAVTGG